MGVTCDGNSANRHFYKLHSKEKEEVYKVKNPFILENRPIFFLSDPPHLIKTMWNCWASQKRNLWICIIFNYGVVMNWLTVATFNLWGLAEWKGDYVEPSIGFVQEMCWIKNQHTRIDPSSSAEV